MATTNTRKAILIRTGIVYAGMICFAIAIVVNIFNLKIKRYEELKQKAEQIQIKKEILKPERGSIFDCNGKLLATSLPIYKLILDGLGDNFAKKELFEKGIDSTAYKLSKIFNDKSPELYKKILTEVREKKKQYYVFKTGVKYNDMIEVKNLDLFKNNKHRETLHLEEEYRRKKPFGPLASRTIGFYVIGQKPVGIDGSFNEYLEGKSGIRHLLKIAKNNYIPLNREADVEAENGKDIISTLDITLQDVAENSLFKMLDANEADKGVAIVMEVKTGEIKAMANLTRKGPGLYAEDINHALLHRTDPGSTFKLVSMMALFEEGRTSAETIVDAQGGKIHFQGMSRPMIDSHLGFGKISLQYAFEQSSNVAIAKRMLEIFGNKPNELFKFYQSIGLMDTVGIDIKGENEPLLNTPGSKNWSKSTLPNMSIGYELDITPLYIITIYNAIANNGAMVKPKLVKRITYNGSIVKEFETEYINKKVCSENTVKQLKKMMEGVVLRGTAKDYRGTDYSFAGKTGTAKNIIQKPDEKPIYKASFCGYFPADNPQYTCYVLIENPKKEDIYGAKLALPVFKDIADKIFSQQIGLHKDLRFAKHHATDDLPFIAKAKTVDLKNIYNKLGVSHHIQADTVNEEESIWAYTNNYNHAVAIKPMLHKGNAMPTVEGMTAKDAIYLLESKGYKVLIQGKGKVINQSVQAGNIVNKGTTVILKLG
ncbi:MAG: penicillin-binding protein [Bacteroidia bacterium]